MDAETEKSTFLFYVATYSNPDRIQDKNRPLALLTPHAVPVLKEWAISLFTTFSRKAPGDNWYISTT